MKKIKLYPKVRLEPITVYSTKLDELSLIAHWRNESMISLRSSEPTDPLNQFEWVQSFNDSVRYFYIYHGELFVGYCGLDKIHPVNKTAELGLLVGPNYRKINVGRGAVLALLKFGFTELNLNLIFIEVYATTNNINFWLKQGFITEGKLRQRKFWEGNYYDSIMASMTKTDWVNLGETYEEL